MENQFNKTNQTQGQNQAGSSTSASSQGGVQGSNRSSNVQGTSSGISSQQNSGNASGFGLNNITDKLQQFGSSTMSSVNNLSTTQKVVGGSLIALGAGWLAMNSMNKGKSKKSGGTYIKNRKS